MGLTGANGFPCCGKGAVDIVEIPNDFNYRRPHSQLTEEEEDTEVEEELLEEKPLHKVDSHENLDSLPDLEDSPEMGRGLYQVSKPEAEPQWKMTTLECDPTEQQSYRIETLHPYTEAMPTPRNFKQWRISSNSSLQSVSEKDQILPEHRSIRVQTSKHLFWANKLIQASEHSLQQAVSRQCKERDTEKTPSHPKQESNPNHPLGPEKQFQISRTQSALAVSTCQPTPSPCLSTSSLPPTIGLADLINFASSLAIASSSDIQLPNLEKMIKASPQKSVAPSTEPVKPSAEPAQPTEDNPKLPENPPKAMEPEKAPEQENNSFPSYLDFNKPGVKRTTIEGEVKFLQTQATSPELQKAKEHSVPGTKKGNPLLLKIHFKLSSPSVPE
ncbi:spermatogenesis-associated protein 32 isoform X1 [Sciurus carolinensis]|uniref:spermatogenesis-associated protein 32 isoform X1 n=1 Tax=Sciurus carolinensis TaxID=30640 RepID=UPI001FB48A12|nr:spermatogenesis-associated protein 32 isoform X1 [Sciurus carolinensis]